MVSCLITSDSVGCVQNLGDWAFGMIRCIVQKMVELAAELGGLHAHPARIAHHWHH